MSDRNIGIKLANGQFYPILEDGKPARKRLVVTTVKDDQPSVQIDMYRGSGETAASAAYIGSLVIENIPPRPKGEPDIRLELSLDEGGELLASAREEASGESQSLRVSLQALSEEEKYEIPDFEFEEESREAAATDTLPDLESAEFEIPEMTGPESPEAVLDVPDLEDAGPAEDLLSEEGPEPAGAGGESYIGQSTESFTLEEEAEEASFGEPFPEDASFEEPSFEESPGEPETVANPFEDEESEPKPEPEPKPKKERGSGRALWIILIVLGALALALGLGLIIYRCVTAPKPAAASQPAVPAAQPAPQPAPAPAAQPAPAPAAQPAAPAPAEPPKALPAGMAAYVRPEVAARPGMKPGVNYKIRWGDTLWDLSYVFYRDPWLYPRIARANKIRNPNLIISGRTIWIPPR